MLPILERGVCFDTAANPTLITGRYDPDNTISGDGFGPFEVVIIELEPNKTYHARAYAILQGDTVYGKDLVFTTKEVLGEVPSFINREEGLTVILTKLKNVSKIQWQNKGMEEDVSPADTMLTHTYEEPNVYKITASNEDGDKFSIYITVPNCGGYLTPLYNESYSEESDGYAISEVRDHQGNNYPVVQIGNQCWMAENLRATKYSSTLINTPILLPFVNNPVAGRAYYGVPDNQSVNVPMYGYLYSWDAANGGIDNNLSGIDRLFLKQGICPDGWHIPSEDEFVVLSIIMGGTVYAGQMVKGCSWQAIDQGQNETDPRPGNHGYALRNELGFGALPAGGAICNVPSLEFGKGAAFWSNGALSNPNQALSTRLEYNNSSLNYGNGISNKTDGFSVRCVRNVTLSIFSTEVDPTVKVCNASPYIVTYTATPSEGTNYNYSWQPAGGVVSEGGRVYTLTYRKRIFLVTGYVRLSYCESYGFEWR